MTDDQSVRYEIYYVAQQRSDDEVPGPHKAIGGIFLDVDKAFAFKKKYGYDWIVIGASLMGLKVMA